MSLVPNEEWRPVPGYEGSYSVSNLGRVWTHPRGKGYPKGKPDGGLMTAYPLPKSGYLQVSLSKDNRSRKRYVHQLVLLAFVGPRPGLDYQACHNDGDNSNNALSNLRWDTTVENARDRVRHGTAPHLHITHCPHGHEYTPENSLKNSKGSRICGACRDQYNARRRKAAA